VYYLITHSSNKDNNNPSQYYTYWNLLGSCKRKHFLILVAFPTLFALCVTFKSHSSWNPARVLSISLFFSCFLCTVLKIGEWHLGCKGDILKFTEIAIVNRGLAIPIKTTVSFVSLRGYFNYALKKHPSRPIFWKVHFNIMSVKMQKIDTFPFYSTCGPSLLVRVASVSGKFIMHVPTWITAHHGSPNFSWQMAKPFIVECFVDRTWESNSKTLA
jgi:hypothetical protein